LRSAFCEGLHTRPRLDRAAALVKPGGRIAPLGERAFMFRRAVMATGEGLQMTPRRTDTDGFFIGALVRG
jgi:16S rRNA (cytosine967-C5)-methyltransferase